MKGVNPYVTILMVVMNSFNCAAQGTSGNTQKNKPETSTMKNQDFTTTISVNKTSKEVFEAINNVRGWWSEEIDGNTDRLNAVFDYHYEDLHRSQLKVIEFIPDQKVVWHVMDNYFKFTKDKREWTDTKISFEIAQHDNKTLLHFTHIGLVPEYECFEICQDAWKNYIHTSLYNLITNGKGQPNGTGKPRTENEKKLGLKENDNVENGKHNYSISIEVGVTPQEAFKSINNVTKWWTENLEGNSQKLNDEFTVRFDDVHVSTQKLVEVIPDKKVVWLVTDSQLNFIKDKSEWTNTKIVFEIAEKRGKTQITFTHIGLAPEIECYTDCSGAWSQYIKGSLFKLLTKGKGTPEPKTN